MRSEKWMLPVLAGASCVVCRAAEAPKTAMPLRQVVLFSSGVGYFERVGNVNGGTVELALAPGQVNDILKSLVLFDASGGVRPVTYSVQDFVAQPEDLVVGSDVSLGGLLRRFQGARVRVEMGREAVEGAIISVNARPIATSALQTEANAQVSPSYRSRPDNSPAAPASTTIINNIPAPVLSGVTREIVNILTPTGLRAIALDDVRQVRLLDPILNAKLRAGLEKMAGALTSDASGEKRIVRLRFEGKGVREVRAGYLQETPVWKTSYRLVLDAGAKPYLQGWGQVENTSGEDWQNIQLSLVSGRPVSFIQDLYTPLYVQRPVVASQVAGSPYPQTYGESLQPEASSDAPTDATQDRLSTLESRPTSAARRESPSTLRRSGALNYLSARGRSVILEGSVSGGFGGNMPAAILGRSVATQAQGSERGELFEYAIREPVTLPRGEAALVPIVGESVGGESVSIYDADAANRALNGVLLVNTSGLHLSGGPITVFRDGIYAGDAQITDLAPSESRLISYAVDLDLVAKSEGVEVSRPLTSLRAREGVLTITRSERTSRRYTFRNKAKTAKTVIVQQRFADGVKLIEPVKAFDQTPNEYRFRVLVPSGGTSALQVVTEQARDETLAVLQADLDLLVSYAQSAPASPQLRAALENIVAQRRKVRSLQTQRAALEAELVGIGEDQARIRQNMERLNQDSPLYKQYVAKLTAQETRIARINDGIARFRQQETAAQAALRVATDRLTL